MTVREFIQDTSEGFVVLRQQECDKILQALKETPEHEIRTVNTQNCQKYIGSVPSLLAVEWAKEWGVQLFSHEWLGKVRHRLKHDPDWKYLRPGG